MVGGEAGAKRAMKKREVARRAGLWLTCLALGACGSVGPFVWVNDLPKEPQAAAKEYAIAAGDSLVVRVLGHDDLSNLKARVREDGRIVLPLVGEVPVQGLHPSALRADLETRLKSYVKEPTVTIDVEQSRASTVSVLGEVPRPGVYPIEAGTGLARLLAEAGGLSRFADRERIFVLRNTEPPQRIRFTYESLSRGEMPASGFALRAGDIVVIE